LRRVERRIVAILQPFQALVDQNCKIVAIVHPFDSKSPIYALIREKACTFASFSSKQLVMS
jgi:hypothetical protein